MGKKRRALVILRKKGRRVAVFMKGEPGDVIPMLGHALGRAAGREAAADGGKSG